MGSELVKILIVEDDMILSMVLKRMIKMMNNSIIAETATTGKGAIETAADFLPDLILVDIKLQDDIDGIEVVNRIREKSPVPVIYITGNSDQYYRDRAKETGYVKYMVKPIQMKDLERAITEVVDGKL